MATKDVGNTVVETPTASVNDQSSDSEFDALFEDITEEFGAGEEAYGDDYTALNAALYEIADGTVAESGTADEAELFGFIKRRFEKRARQAMKALIRKVKSARKYAKCIPALLKVIAAVKAGRWGTAIREALATWRCIRNA